MSLSSQKEMDVFGGVWEGYTEKILKNFSLLSEEDTIVLCGDTSWAMNMTTAHEDFSFINTLPGKKLLIKGNHDYWWDTAGKMKRFFDENYFGKLNILHNNAYLVEDIAVCGTRGWFFEEETGLDQDRKIMLREIGRLRASLESGKKLNASELVVFLHYPPLYEGYRCDGLVELLNEYSVQRCFYGHLHGYSRSRAIEGIYRGVFYSLISADHVNFMPIAVNA